MVRVRARVLAAAVPLALAACGGVTGLPDADPVPVVLGTLVTESPRQRLRVDWSVPVSDAAPPQPVPVPDDDVALRLVGAAGASATFLPGERPGEHVAELEVRPGATYHVRGTVAGRAVDASVVVPMAPRPLAPAADTLRLSRSDWQTHTFPVTWSRVDAAGYRVIAIGAGAREREVWLTEGASGSVSTAVADTTGYAHLDPREDAVLDTMRLAVGALDRTAFDRSLARPVPRAADPLVLVGAEARGGWVVVWR